MHRLLNDAAEEIERLRTKCNSQSRILTNMSIPKSSKQNIQQLNLKL